jgi:outer membrane protein OmpA-like peptidoglycan-associated protein
MAWLVSKGIDAKRLRGKGYGESQLLNRCKDGVKCSEEEHLKNRRSEFMIISI